mmetsp:Transcript_5542/g.13700  ORF Transcript_5542/g.13700 Transcript_5542/m.13700 type:complete len:252 (-) Transcript_5542:120-875(-)
MTWACRRRSRTSPPSFARSAVVTIAMPSTRRIATRPTDREQAWTPNRKRRTARASGRGGPRPWPSRPRNGDGPTSTTRASTGENPSQNPRATTNTATNACARAGDGARKPTETSSVGRNTATSIRRAGTIDNDNSSNNNNSNRSNKTRSPSTRRGPPNRPSRRESWPFKEKRLHSIDEQNTIYIAKDPSTNCNIRSKTILLLFFFSDCGGRDPVVAECLVDYYPSWFMFRYPQNGVLLSCPIDSDGCKNWN